MTADSRIYASERMGAAYAFTRPPVHRQVVVRAFQYLARPWPVGAALDIGCGAGASTAALTPFARSTVGLDPHASMLKYATEVAPEAEFFLARAEALPFAPGTFELITAAGALNYANVELSLSEIARVLSANGVFVPYDFSAGRRIRDDARLGQWHREFLIRFPSQPGYSLDLPSLCYESHGLTLLGYEKLEVEIPMSLPAYVGYILGEAGVELALSEGQAEADIRRYCEECLKPIFAHGPREVLFDAQVAYVRVR